MTIRKPKTRLRLAAIIAVGLGAATLSACSESKDASGSGAKPSGTTQEGSANAPSGTKSPADGSSPARSGS